MTRIGVSIAAVMMIAAPASAQSSDERETWSRAIEAQERALVDSLLDPLERGELSVYRGEVEIRDNTIATPGHVTDFAGPIVAILRTTEDARWLLALARADGAHALIEQHPMHPGRTYVSAPVDAMQVASGSAGCDGCVPSLAARPARLEVVMDARGWDEGRTRDGNVVIHARVALERVDGATLDARALIDLVPALRASSSIWRDVGPSLRLERGAIVRDVRGVLRLPATRRDDGASCGVTVEYELTWRIAPRAISISRPVLHTHVTSCCRFVAQPGRTHASSCTPPPRICDRAEVPLGDAR
ncbi:hypothetical protein [Sandaracinus amylolyticus]|uniref:hypothetical protein n=1 Tax=Sandaracinus amylolyticus TaxID=927083 RepID=UPI001F17A8DE|nr:hypothetical protein [Sandaracinus amylolyticus]UJR83358.1 Hypothetical protein I5071_54260 [Sandaracinus amylolyticus]